MNYLEIEFTINNLPIWQHNKNQNSYIKYIEQQTRTHNKNGVITMKITNLNHIEVATQEVIGGHHHRHRRGIAVANAGADSLAIGRYTSTSTSTGTLAIAGVLSASSSGSNAVAFG